MSDEAKLEEAVAVDAEREKLRPERDSDMVAELRKAKKAYAAATEALKAAREAVPAALVAEAQALKLVREIQAKLMKSVEAGE